MVAPRFRALLVGVILGQAVGGLNPDQDASSGLIWACIIAFSCLVAAGIGFPIPEELPIVGAGIWVGHNPEAGPLKWLILPVCIAGVVISDGLLYGIGRYFGPKILEWRLIKRILPPQKREQIEKNFHQYGVLTLLFARFLPAIRSPIFITAGIMRLSFAKFVIADGIYAIPGVSLLFFLSYWFGDQFRDLVERAEKDLRIVRPLLILLAIAAVAGFLAYHFLRRPVAIGDPEEFPIIGKVAAKIGPHERAATTTPAQLDTKPSSDGTPQTTSTTEKSLKGPGSISSDKK
jgi:membrane protein DedA with SNARE-associated domain